MISSELRYVLVFLVALFGSLFILPKLTGIATRIGLIDHPNARKVHTTPRPLVGGIGMTISATFGALLFASLHSFLGLFLGMCLLLMTGFLDDYKELGARHKFLAQIGASALMIWFSNNYLLSFGDLLGIGSLDIPEIQPLIWVVTVFSVVGVINSINMIDGLDGLAGGVSFVAFMSFAIHGSLIGAYTVTLVNLALAGAVLGFLYFNWTPAKIFMGDAGSLTLGFCLAFMSIYLTQSASSSMPPVCALLILAVPITDTVVIMTKRGLQGKSPFKADKRHLHHILISYGMSKKNAVKTIVSLCVLFSAISLSGIIYKVPENVLFAIFAAYFIIYTAASFKILFFARVTRHYLNNGYIGAVKKYSAIFTGILVITTMLFLACQ